MEMEMAKRWFSAKICCLYSTLNSIGEKWFREYRLNELYTIFDAKSLNFLKISLCCRLKKNANEKKRSRKSKLKFQRIYFECGISDSNHHDRRILMKSFFVSNSGFHLATENFTCSNIFIIFNK